MKTEKINPTDYWQQQMLHIIEMSHPYLLRDKDSLGEIIVARADAAYDEYKRQIENGQDVHSARAAGREILLDGYKWSPTDFLGSLFYGEFNQELSEEEKIKLFFKYNDLFKEYSNADLFENPKTEELLKESLLERINA